MEAMAAGQHMEQETTVVPRIILYPGRISGVPQEGPGGIDNSIKLVYRPGGGHWTSVYLWIMYIY